IAELGDKAAVALALDYAQAECRLAEIDRARAIYAYAAPMVDPRTATATADALAWTAWHEFEVQHGNEDTFKEMLRVKRLAQTKLNTDARFLAAAEIEQQKQKQQAKLKKDAEEKEKAEADGGGPVSNPDALDIDDDDLPYPIFVSGAVVKGYGRGSKQLGIPTANLPEEAVQRALADIAIGVYYGWAQVVDQNGGGPVLPMVMSLGWNPFFKNEKRSGEVHIIHKFSEDFYGKDLRIAIVGFIREEKNYESLDALVDDINMDIKVAQESLKRKAYMD
ncbi:riboflavin kinase, partial [Coemansia sp. RSA 1694]